MTWTKLSDDFPDDCYTLSNEAYRLHVEGLCWSNKKLLDLHLRPVDLRRLACAEALPELLEKGFWEADEDGWFIVHHGMYQRTRQQVIDQQRANSENGSKGGRPRKPKTQPVSKPLSESRSETETEGDGTGRDGLLDGKPLLRAVSGDWPVVHRCSVCHGVLDVSLGSTHPTCGES